MTYVSCRYSPPPPDGVKPLEGHGPWVICTDEHGREWWVTEDDALVDEWIAYKMAGGIITPYTATTSTNIRNAPGTLFGGPSIARVLGEPL